MPFETVIAGIAVRGRMDAVFADPDGGFTVVDWKTGALPDDVAAAGAGRAARRVPAGLGGAGRGARRSGCGRRSTTCAHDVTLRPADLLDADGLRALLESVPTAARPAS